MNASVRMTGARLTGNRSQQIALSLLASLVVPIVSLIFYFVWTRFLVYQPAVCQIVKGIEPEVLGMSAEAKDVLDKLNQSALAWLATKRILNQVAPERVGMAEWHARGMVWQLLLPLHLTVDEMTAIYAESMQFEDGQGIVYGARKYYGRIPSELSRDQAIGLVAISWCPSRHSPILNPSEFEKKFGRLKEKYQLLEE